jgi:hypothetical protein
MTQSSDDEEGITTSSLIDMCLRRDMLPEYVAVLEEASSDKRSRSPEAAVSPSVPLSFPVSSSISRAYRWAFTCWDDPDAGITRLKQCIDVDQSDITFVVYQLERDKQNKPHAQGYIEVKRNGQGLRMNQVKQLFREPFCRTVHVEVARSNAQANINYCTKEKNAARIEGTEVVTRGTPSAYGRKATTGAPASGGDAKRNYLHELIDALYKGNAEGKQSSVVLHTLLHCGDVDEESLLKLRAACAIHRLRVIDPLCYRLDAMLVPSVRDVKIEVIWGPPGSGKSTKVLNMFDPIFYRLNVLRITETCGRWFPYYSGQKVLVFDDFKGHPRSPGEILQLCDRFALDVEVKGGFTKLGHDRIIFISNLHPKDWWDYQACYDAGRPCACSPSQMASLMSRIKDNITFENDVDLRLEQ